MYQAWRTKKEKTIWLTTVASEPNGLVSTHKHLDFLGPPCLLNPPTATMVVIMYFECSTLSIYGCHVHATEQEGHWLDTVLDEQFVAPGLWVILYQDSLSTYSHSVFNLKISQSGSYVPHKNLKWVIWKMLRVKLWNFKKVPSSKHRRPKVSCSLCKRIVFYVSHKMSMTCFFLRRTVAKDIHFSMQGELFSQCYLVSLKPLALEVLELDLTSNWLLQLHHPYPAHFLDFLQLPFSFA